MRLTFCLVALLCLVACDVDLFGNDQRSIIGGYRLHAVEDGSVLLRPPSDTGSTFSAPAVESIGWDSTRILVHWARSSRWSRGYDFAGKWEIIELRSGFSRGPFTDSDVAADSALRHIETFSAEAALRGRAHISPGA
jgi:hypothetical protein